MLIIFLLYRHVSAVRTSLCTLAWFLLHCRVWWVDQILLSMCANDRMSQSNITRHVCKWPDVCTFLVCQFLVCIRLVSWNKWPWSQTYAALENTAPRHIFNAFLIHQIHLFQRFVVVLRICTHPPLTRYVLWATFSLYYTQSFLYTIVCVWIGWTKSLTFHLVFPRIVFCCCCSWHSGFHQHSSISDPPLSQECVYSA